MSFDTRWVGPRPDAIAPDGSEVRVLCMVPRGGMATFSLRAGAVTKAVAHRTVDEIWCVLTGKGRMWRRLAEREETIDLVPGLSLTIPVGTEFQFRCDGDETLTVLAATMPPWPGPGEAYPVEGPWPASG
jgi:mannose-6-phosphate isomerase-like protein (cupin superfamily)